VSIHIDLQSIPRGWTPSNIVLASTGRKRTMQGRLASALMLIFLKLEDSCAANINWR
ncbi:hypothetical protein A2U01_0067161, partial [Trifolium medium]|nr:hypothetical protein [Trifolium medium]